jgi:hypothetical protein
MRQAHRQQARVAQTVTLYEHASECATAGAREPSPDLHSEFGGFLQLIGYRTWGAGRSASDEKQESVPGLAFLVHAVERQSFSMAVEKPIATLQTSAQKDAALRREIGKLRDKTKISSASSDS